MTKATITTAAENLVAMIWADEELRTTHRITYEVKPLIGSGRADGGTQIVADVFTTATVGGPFKRISYGVPMPRVRKAGEWLGFLHDEINRLLAQPMKLPASTAKPRR